MSKNTDNRTDGQGSPAAGAAAPPDKKKASNKSGQPVTCLAIRQFTHDDRTYKPARSEKAGRKVIEHPADRIKLPRAWADHHVKEGNVVREKDYPAWLEKQAKDGDA